MKIPKNAKLVFKGILFDIYNWKQKMFDGSFETFEMIKRVPTTQIITITKDKKIIILKEQQPSVGEFLSLPGGHVERNEIIKDNAIKELKEEVGIENPYLELWKIENFGSKIDWQTYYYICKNCEITKKNNPDSGEKIKIFKVDFDKFIEMTQEKGFRNKNFKDYIFRLIQNKIELENFKKLILN